MQTTDTVEEGLQKLALQSPEVVEPDATDQAELARRKGYVQVYPGRKLVDAQMLVQKLKDAQELKERGTGLLCASDISAALDCYSAALELLRVVHTPPPSAGLAELWHECTRRGRELELACWLNASLCHVKLEQWASAMDAASEALHLDGKSVKALFRRGMARSRLGDADAAFADLRDALRLAPQDDAIRRELSTAKARTCTRMACMRACARTRARERTGERKRARTGKHICTGAYAHTHSTHAEFLHASACLPVRC